MYLSLNSDKSHKLGATEVADKLDVPKHFLAKILQRLSKQNLISSVKGPQGGFYINDVQSKMPIINIIKALDGPDIFNSCILGLSTCSDVNPCPLHDSVVHYKNGLQKVLNEESLKDFSDRLKNKFSSLQF
jgi:Rrf2 family protein